MHELEMANAAEKANVQDKPQEPAEPVVQEVHETKRRRSKKEPSQPVQQEQDNGGKRDKKQISGNGERKPKRQKTEKTPCEGETNRLPAVSESKKGKQTDAKRKSGKQKKVREIALPHPLPQTRADQMEALVAFGGRFEKKMKKSPFRQSVKADLAALAACRLNIYWTRLAVGVRDPKTGKDFAYFYFSDEKAKYQVHMAITVKTAEMFVPWIDCFI